MNDAENRSARRPEPPVAWPLWQRLAFRYVVCHFLLHVGFSFGQGAPDLLTVALLLFARETGLGRAGAAGLGLGLLEDALSAVAFGANSVAMTIVGVGGAFTRDYFGIAGEVATHAF